MFQHLSIICILFSKFILLVSTVAKTQFLVTRIGPCDSSSESVVSVSEMVLVRNTYDSSLSGSFNISEDIVDGWRMKASMQKCSDIRNMDTCDYLRSFTILKEGCVHSDDVEEREIYSMFYNHVTPSLSCPLQAGRYTISDYPFFTEDGGNLSATESKISTSEFGYTFQLTIDIDDRMLLCVDAYLKLQYVREHSWLSAQNRSGHVTNTDDPATQGEDDNELHDTRVP